MKTAKFAAVLLSFAVVSAGAGRSFGQVVPAGAATAAAVKEVIARSKVDAVTVYRGQALVTREVEMPAGAGVGELVISELPQRVLAASIFAEGGEGVEIRSVRYRERAVPVDVREEVRKLDDAIMAISDKIAANQKQMQVLQEQRTYLDKLEGFIAPTATVEMTKGVLNADQLKILTTFQFETRQNIAKQELQLQQEARSLQEQASLLVRQKGDAAGRSNKTAREAVIFINRERAGGSLRLKYLVDNASWSPSYNVRADSEKKSATVEYLAAIAQMSGEDWGDVSMTLSTASPNLVAAAPTLNPLEISLTTAAPGGARGGGGGGAGGGGFGGIDLSSAYGNIAGQRQSVEQVRNTVGNGNFELRVEDQMAQQFKNDMALNKVADQLQVLELITRDSKSETRPASISAKEGIVVTYQLKTRTSLQSRSDRQLVQIDQLPLKSTFYKVAVPVLTSYVYDQADMVNTSSSVLLAGPVASYVGGQFVGSGTIDTVAVGQPFTVGFGIDSALRATRERSEKTEQTQTGNRIVNYTYRLAIENFGNKAAEVRLMDRIPTGKDTEVKVIFEEADNVKLSTDKEYQQTDRKKNLLRWDVQVPAQTSGSEAFALSYKLKLEHDKNLTISTSGVLSQELYQMLTK